MPEVNAMGGLVGLASKCDCWLERLGLSRFQFFVVAGMFIFGYFAKLGQNNGLQPERPHEHDHDD